MSEIQSNRQNLYDNLISDGYFRGDDGEINLSFDDFCEALADQENARVFFQNIVDDGYFRDDDGEPTFTEQEFLEMVGSTRPKRMYYPITENQRGVFIDWEMNSDTTQYNIPDVSRFPAVSSDRLRDAVVKVIDAHPYLKTHFAKKDDDVVQVRCDELPAMVAVEHLDAEPDAAFFQKRVRPFNLLEGPLYRAEIYYTAQEAWLFLDIHHSIFDGASSIVFTGELQRVLAGGQPQGEQYTAFDHAQDESDFRHSDACRLSSQNAEQYFEQKLSGIDTTVYPRSSTGTSGAAVRKTASTTIQGKTIAAYCRRNETTESNYFLTMLLQVLHRITREEDILITTIHHGRTDLRLMETMGMLVKTLPVVSSMTSPQAAKTSVSDAIKAVQSQMLETQKHDIFPFTKIAERYGVRAEIMYVCQVGGIRTEAGNGLNGAGQEGNGKDLVTLDLDTAKTPLSLTVIPVGAADYQLLLKYDGSLYSEADMQALCGMLAVASLSAPEARTLADIMLLTEEEQKAVVALSAGKHLDVDISQTFVGAFEQRARQVPDNVAVTDEEGQLTYRQLSGYSDLLAHRLIAAGVRPDDFVCVMLDRHKEFPLSVLAIHKAGAAYTPLDIEYPGERLQYMLENSESRVLVTTHTVLQRKRSESEFKTDGVQVLFIDDIDFSLPSEPVNLATPDRLAYMIYTSGSTGMPKGVMLHQAGLWNFTVATVDINRLTAADRISSHRSFSFDAHIEDLFPVLSVGGSVHIMPSEIRKDLNRIYDFLNEHQITGGGYTTSIARMLLKDFHLKQRFITCGGEALTGVVSGSVQVINVYGPTECTDHAATCCLEKGRHYDTIPIGRPLPNTWCFIVDGAGRLVPRGTTGELCIAGIQVGRGYWQQPDRTTASFVPCPFVSTDRWGRPVRMYHTGDLCRYNEQGLLEYIGRTDFQVKLRGFRIELGEIESKALQIAGIRQTAADVKKVMGAEHLILYYTQTQDADINEADLRKTLESSSLAAYMVPDTYMRLDSMPMTPNGKVNRKALPIPEIKAEEIVAPETETEKKLLDVAAELLKHDQFGVTTNLVSVGLTSLTAMRLSAMIQSRIGSDVPTVAILQNPTLRHIATIIDGDEDVRNIQTVPLGPKERFPEQEIHELREYYPITENQRGVYIDWEMNRNTTQYNLPSVVKMPGVDANVLREALVRVVDAHPYLKTRLAMIDDDVVQLRLDDEQAVVEMIVLNEEPTADFFRTRVRPFDLFHDRLYRMEIYQTPTTVWFFHVIHHVIFDGGSELLLRNELEKTLRGEPLAPETYTAFDRALDELQLQQSAQYEQAEQYFDTLLEDVEMIPYPHSDKPDGADERNNDYVEVTIDKKSVDEFSSARSVTANNFFLTVLMQVLHRLTREDRLAITTISNGRSDTRMHAIMGMFVKTLPAVSRLDKKQSFTEALQQMNQQSVRSQGYDIYPFTKIADRYKFRSEIMYVFQGGLNSPFATPADRLARRDACQSKNSIPLDLDTVKMPVAFMVTETADGQYNIQIEYDTHLYSKADITLLANALKTFATHVIGGVDDLRDISLVDDNEQTRIIHLSKGEALAYDRRETFVDMVCHFGETTPDAIAIVDKASRITYRELDRQSNILAARLISEGITPNSFVCIMMGRQKEFVTSLLAVMKAGAAYVPMDNEYPTDRLLYMMEDCQAGMLITTHDIYDEKNADGAFSVPNILFIDDLDEIQDLSGQAVLRVNLATPDGLAYMIYTSGSTGKPKGVMQPHRALRAFIAWRIAKLGLNPESRNAEHASFSFDASLDDLLCTLAAGGRLYILPENLRKDIDGIYNYIMGNRITGMTLSTALGMTMLDQYPDIPMNFMMMGGEKMLPFRKTNVKVINGYGPTEFTVCSSFHVVDQAKDTDIPIGRPVPNSCSFVVDSFGQLLPFGAAGELCLSGPQLSAGYWHRAELTAERFCELPFGYKAYFTGDLARWNENGELEFLGRIDNQVKLRGFRIELGEIENQASLIEGIKAVAAEVREAGGSKHLVLYFTADREMDSEAIRAQLAQTLTEYMVPDTYMQLDVMPLTPNGKVNRRGLPQPVIRSAAEYVEPQTDAERTVAQAMQEVLGLKQAIGVLDSFFAWGGDSIKSIRLVSRLRAAGITLQVADIMKLKTVREIAAAGSAVVVEADQDAWSGEVPPPPITRFFFDLNLPKPYHFNQTMLLRAAHRVQAAALQAALAALVTHHDMLRAIVKGGQLYVRKVGEPGLYGWEQMDFTEDADYANKIADICRMRQRSIHLNSGPLLKVVLFNTPDYDAVLMVCHHLVVDGVSWRVLHEDFTSAYSQALSGKDIVLPRKTHSYKAYAEAVEQYAGSHELSLETPYWDSVQEKLRQTAQSKAKDSRRKMKVRTATLDSATTHSIMTTAGDWCHADINDLLLTALGMSYCRLTGETTVSVQMEGHGREYVGDVDLTTDRTVGWFTSVYPVVLEHLDGDVRTCLRLTKETMHRIPNKGVGYNILRFLTGNTNYSTSLCALIGFNYLGEMSAEEGGGAVAFVPMTEISAGEDIAPENVFGPDLSINCAVTGGTLGAKVAYNTALFTEEQAQRLLDGMMRGLQELAAFAAGIEEVEVTATDLGEYEWTDEDFRRVYSRFAEMGTPLQRIYPLSPMQEGMVLKFMLEPNSLAYRLVSRVQLDILPTKEQLRYALSQLGAKHEVLRTNIIYHDVEQYRQAIVRRPLGLEMRDISDACDKEKTMRSLYRSEQERGFDLEREPLFRIVCVKTSATTCEMLLAVHHIIVDGWCIKLYMSDLIKFLSEAVEGRMKPVGPWPAGRYENFIRHLLRKDTAKGLAYWKGLLDGYAVKAVIPSAGMVPEGERAADNVCRLQITGGDWTALRARSVTAGVTVNTVVELAWGLVLQVYNRRNDVVFVKVVSGRNNAQEGVEDVVGLFINSVPVRVCLKPGTTVAEALRALQQQAAESNEWDFCPLSAIQQVTGLGGDLFQSIMAFENYESDATDGDGPAAFHFKWVWSKEEPAGDITVVAYADGKEGLTVNLEFDHTKYRRTEMEQLADVMRRMLLTIAHRPETDVCNIQPLDRKGIVSLAELGMGGTITYDAGQTLPDLFREQARKTPDGLCIAFREKRMTYREVDDVTDRLAALLQREYDVEPETAVGVMIDRSELMFIYPMAVMKAGAAYMPLDFHFPAGRLMFMCRDAGVSLILSEGNRVAEAMPEYAGRVLTGDVLEHLDGVKGTPDPKRRARPENMFVVLYTSGSTGTPKGVVLEHRNIVNFCHWYVREFDVTADDRAVAYANFGFDAHMMDLYPVTSAGGSVFIIDSDMRMDLLAMNGYMEREGLTISFMTTQVGYMFATTIENHSLRLLSVGGEKLQPLSRPPYRFYNGYGPTECTVYSTFYRIEGDYDSSYIGRPLAGCQLYVVDQNLNMVPRGAAGELIVAGAGVGRGYLNRPELNREKFITFMGQRAYRTGDLVRWSPDGNIEFLGRIDNQVKLRGLRIELGEIEAHVSKFPQITTTAVDVKEVCGAQHICCYFTADTRIDVDSLRKFLSDKLTDFMMPTAFMQMERLPLTSNGKVNRRALPVPAISVNTENVAPDTEKETIMYDIARELLKTDQFGVTDDLTRLGLTSLLAIKLVMMAKKKNIRLKLDDLMKRKSIRATLQHNVSLLAWAMPYEEDKPVVVVVCGATPYQNMEPYIGQLAQHYSVLVCEPIQEHYDYVFKEADINEVVNLYYTVLDYTLPIGVKVVAFTGHCFGGEIAYRLAIRWAQETGDWVPMVMLDVFWRVDPLEFDEQVLLNLLPQHVIDKYGNAIRSYTKSMYMYDKLGREGEPPHYEGDVVLFRASEVEPDSPIMSEIYAEAPGFREAWQSVISERSMDNALFWRQYYPEMEIYNMPAHHMSMLEKQHAATYVEWLDAYIKNHGLHVRLDVRS